MLSVLLMLACRGAVPEGSIDGVRALEVIHVADERLFDVVFSDDGEHVLSVIGRFDIGEKATSEVTSAEAATVGFIREQASLFQLPSDFGATLKADRVRQVNDALYVVDFHQEWDQVPLLDSTATASFWSDGYLHSVNGPFYPQEPFLQDATTFENIAEVLADLAPDFAALDFVYADGVWRTDGPERAIRMIDREVHAAVWVVTTQHETIYVDEVTRVPYRFESNESDSYYRQCDFNMWNFNRDAGGLMDNLESVTGSQAQDATCQGEHDPFWSRYYWQLRYEASGTTHQLGRIDDASNPEAEALTAFLPGSSTHISFSTSSAYRNQYTSYYFAKSMRSAIINNVFNNATPSSQDNVKIYINANEFGCINPGALACFNSATTNITIEQPVTDKPSQVLHEYGHYVVWAYGNQSQNCTSSDRGNAINETMSDVFGLIAVADDRDAINAKYSTTMILSQFPGRHTTTNLVTFNPSAACTTSSEIHVFGQALEQAVWELLWNRNCTVAPCFNSSATYGNEVWINVGRDTVIDYIGDGFGTALSVLGPSITYSQLVSQFVNRLSILDADGGANADAVLIHHDL